MGAGGTKEHEPGAVAPATAPTATTAPVIGANATAVVEQFQAAAATTDLADLAALATTTIDESGLSPAETQQATDAINTAAGQIVSEATNSELLQAAGHAGLPLAGAISATDLADEPAIGAAVGTYLTTGDIDQHLAVHAAMSALAANEPIPAVLDDTLEHLEGDQTWTGTLTEFNEAIAAYDDVIALGHQATATEQLEAINRVWGYQPEPGPDGTEELVAWARHKCTNPAFKHHLDPDSLDQLPASVTDVDKAWLPARGLCQVASMATPIKTRLALKAQAQTAQNAHDTIAPLAATAWTTPPASIDDLSDWVDNNASIAAALANPTIAKYRHQIAKATGTNVSTSDVTTGFRTWAKTQKLVDLRAAASSAGLTDANAASRAQIQNYLAAAWDPKHDPASIQAAVTAKTQPAAAATPTSTASAKAPSSQPQTPKAKPSTTMAATPVATSTNPFHANVVSLAAKAATASRLATDLPTPTPQPAIAGHDWAANHLGAFSKGSHESHLYVGPDGSGQWLFKPDKSNHGARAHAEAAASRIFAAAGVATVDVHVAKIGKRTGAIQPMIAGASQLDATPSKWTQSDVDQIVANHVVCWAVGDHDAHAANMLRTPTGAIVGIDHGQAFKFCGTDKLSANWKPSANPSPAVHSQLYKAAADNQLAPGVTLKASAAIGAIKKLQAVPDATYRSWLTPTATEGVKHGVAWVPAMRKAAQARHGTTAVTDQQVADEFVATMVDRKNNLSAAFSAFLTKQGVSDAAHISLLAPAPTSTAA